MKCTIKDIARELGLSRNTISKALNGHSGVSPETQKLVLQKAREMDYQRFLMESSVVSAQQAQGTILFLTCSSVDYSDFWICVMRGIETSLQGSGYNLALGVMSRDDFEHLRFPALMSDKIIKGVVIVEICDLRVCTALLNFGIPVVTVDMPNEYQSLLGKMDIITMENKTNVIKVVDALVKKGKRRFAFAGDIRSSNVGRGFCERYEAMCEALAKNDLAPEADCCLLDAPNECFINYPQLKKRIELMLPPPEVFICGNDWTALHLMYTLQSMGYRVPEDIALVGFDDTPDALKSAPPISTISTPKEYLGMAAGNALIERIKQPERPYIFAQYSTELVLRGSTPL